MAKAIHQRPYPRPPIPTCLSSLPACTGQKESSEVTLTDVWRELTAAEKHDVGRALTVDGKYDDGKARWTIVHVPFGTARAN